MGKDLTTAMKATTMAMTEKTIEGTLDLTTGKDSMMKEGLIMMAKAAVVLEKTTSGSPNRRVDCHGRIPFSSGVAPVCVSYGCIYTKWGTSREGYR